MIFMEFSLIYFSADTIKAKIEKIKSKKSTTNRKLDIFYMFLHVFVVFSNIVLLQIQPSS